MSPVKLIPLLLMAVAASGAPVVITGSLVDANKQSLSGNLSVFQEKPEIAVTHYEVEGTFEISANSEGGLVLHAWAEGHPSVEHVVESGASGKLEINFTLPLGQEVIGRVVDEHGNGLEGAALQVRYDEPHKSIRRVLMEQDVLTDGDGQFTLPNVGVGKPFYIDVYAPSYLAKSSKRIKLEAGQQKVNDIILEDPGGTVVVELVNEDGLPVSGVEVLLFADTAAWPQDAEGSWLHHNSFEQRGTASEHGNVRFSGVPPGRIAVEVKTKDGRVTEELTAVANQETKVTLSVF